MKDTMTLSNGFEFGVQSPQQIVKNTTAPLGMKGTVLQSLQPASIMEMRGVAKVNFLISPVYNAEQLHRQSLFDTVDSNF